ncbi:hypothetical protein QNH23_13845 [Siminovitchia fortis]|uniref:Uncharacterized protein n=1 Tax=Siminovitchia fortis TaxID=254758 RepID=A0A443IVL9_9BACI|nr:hypothetical protein [Siminovitchia fortis]RWR12187.1 hypothetical protein D4N35_007400 [Siminovitchia fortis]WHY80976.1 hypothetical protein QNH23_13845 [Siminovitchia fortis]
MTDYKFDDELNISLVRGIERGYSDYAEVRMKKRDELLVSAAYAWVKGNHIEDQVAREVQNKGLGFKKEKAGYTWEYLSFNDPKKKSLLLIKNADIIKGKKSTPVLDAKTSDNYLVELSKINGDIDFGKITGSEQGSLKLFDFPEYRSIDNINIKDYNLFYILTYSIDPETKILSAIDLWMPEYKSGSQVEMAKVDSLTKYLGNTGADINLGAIEELVNVPEEEFSGTQEEFGYKVVDKEAEEEA